MAFIIQKIKPYGSHAVIYTVGQGLESKRTDLCVIDELYELNS